MLNLKRPVSSFWLCLVLAFAAITFVPVWDMSWGERLPLGVIYINAWDGKGRVLAIHLAASVTVAAMAFGFMRLVRWVVFDDSLDARRRAKSAQKPPVSSLD